ncbi:hypothetical protein [Halobacterium salinarum]|uniref:hypothetical protein n=1 Tax=Halobacterium salinarum TaxID=2242 RepID=UPI00255410A3|nr:hypothetical protein [Halobacterium salinarum]MDL0145548.1 hypothetical protein [Halobacterium salinarum]
MPEYRLSYRLYGPVNIQNGGKIQDAVLQPRSEQHSVEAVLEFTTNAADPDEAKDLAQGEYREKAQEIINILSYVVEDGVFVGEPYEVSRTDQNYTQRIDSSTNITEFSISIADGILETVTDDLDISDRTKRALTWYTIGLGTQTPEDRLVAFWTGLEASAEVQSSLSEDEQDAFDGLMETVEDELEEFDDLRQRVRSMLGHLQNERYTDAVKRTLKEETEYDEEDVDDISTIGSDRGTIVHQGEHVDNAVKKASSAQAYLRSLLNNRLSENIDGLVDFDLPLDLEDRDGSLYRPEHPTVAPEDWLAEVFEHERGKVLSEEQIFERAYPIFRDIHKVAKIQTLLPNVTGWGQPLRACGGGEYEYAPFPDWITPEVDAILQYLGGAGEVPPEVIARNANNIRNDVELDPDEAERLCNDLVNRRLAEEADGYYTLTQDGAMCLDGRLDPAEYIE